MDFFKSFHTGTRREQHHINHMHPPTDSSHSSIEVTKEFDSAVLVAETEDIEPRDENIRTSNGNNATKLTPPPNEDLKAWSQAIFALLVSIYLNIKPITRSYSQFKVCFNTWGYIQSFGTWQAHYTATLPQSASTISWIGSVQIFLLFGVGLFSGRALDAGIFRPIIFVGLALQLVGIFMTSAVPLKFWHILLSQGVAQGIGNGLLLCPTMALLGTYFERNRALAFGIAASGSSFGGIIYPLIVGSLLPKLGFPWTVRVCGLVMLGVGIIACTGLRTRPGLPPRKSGPILELSAFKELPYSLFCAGGFCIFFGLFFAFYYIPSFATTVIGESQSVAFSMLTAMNAAGLLFRILPAILADRVTGPLNLIVPFSFAIALLTYAWVGVSSVKGTWGWAVSYGLIAAGVQGLFPTVLSSLTTDPTRQGARMGLGIAVTGMSSTIGPPVGGAILEACGGSYAGAQVWAGSSILLGAILLLAARVVSVGWGLKERI
jgi:MFS family permease